ncbi:MULTISPECIES: hypothetical protein [Chryseobacterium]|uniref:hypothetical protein n=1 Tax=Chryseobacterium TaxID=59732 RepID=UPI000787923A|nr:MULTISPECIES: hypothetical protein [Chryseobacterium]KYH04623.1 hypothetical protein A1704_14700 [Chryseobacterium cucumeris]MDH5035720.1 hypothetical protein [Chryseobacterium cucumeris]QWT88002.1 hypothetical protein KBP46_09315 [Chryseobacterium sp. PCH239]RKE72096.1 hypothetical protein DEU39_4772 [Chryseobacterium sp. AG363]WFB67200.1 hypothetical protein PZ898_21165 [Chryseobacterium sp. WX]
MFNLKWSVLALFIMLPIHAQEIDWDKVNSNTIFNLIARQQTDQSSYGSDIIQIGDYNNAELSLNTRTNIIVRQLGDFNTLYFINSFTDKETKAAITAQGNNNIIDVTGSNSISDGIQINVKGDNKTVFMRNY